MRVLLVEDSVDVAQAINAHLLRLGHTVDWQANGTKAAALVVADHYDLIILDVMLPGVITSLSGCDFLLPQPAHRTVMRWLQRCRQARKTEEHLRRLPGSPRQMQLAHSPR